MTLAEYAIVSNAYDLRNEDEWERTAHIVTAVMNFSGMGASDPVSPDKLYELRKYEGDLIRPITSEEEARELIERM